VKDGNCVNKEYMEANEWGFAARRWGCTFCWLGRTISHNELGRPCYPTCGRATWSWNQHWKRIIINMNWHWNSLNGAVGCDYGRGTFAGLCLDPYQKWCFSVPRNCCTQYQNPKDWKNSILEDNQGFGGVLEKATSKTDGNDHSSTMNLYKEHDSRQTISIMPTSTINSTPTN